MNKSSISYEQVVQTSDEQVMNKSWTCHEKVVNQLRELWPSHNQVMNQLWSSCEGLVIRLGVDFILPLSQQQQEQEPSPKSYKR